MIDLGRSLCGDLASATGREWLVTNGLGGYAMSTVAGLNTRRYHGLLIAALQPPVRRTLMVSKIDETLHIGDDSVPLYSNRWSDGTVEGRGHRNLERFRLDNSTPVWTFAIGDTVIEKRIWMVYGRNTTVVRYQHVRGSAELHVTARVLINYRDHHGATHAGGWHMDVHAIQDGVRVVAFDGATPLCLTSADAALEPTHDWYYGLRYAVEEARGLEPTEDVLHAADVAFTLSKGNHVDLMFSADDRLRGGDSTTRARELARRAAPLLERAGRQRSAVRQLVLAADQFIVWRARPDHDGVGSAASARTAPGDVERTSERQVTTATAEVSGPATAADRWGRSVIAGYPWFADWGRDTMIALPGLTLATGRPEIARDILLTYAGFVEQGMLPNRFPDQDEAPEFNTVDASLWYIEAVRAYHHDTGDRALLEALYDTLADIVRWHKEGTRHNIHVDPEDGLLYAGEEGVQLTWMDAKVGDHVVTPRAGKPVEINALWFNALATMASFAQQLGRDDEFSGDAERVRHHFGRFWNAERGYCFDVIDVPSVADGGGPAKSRGDTAVSIGVDDALRPNQLLAVSLPHSPLDAEQQRAVVDSCARSLLTSHGLRSLAPSSPDYRGHYAGDVVARDSAYHQGTVWAWLIGPFVEAHLRVYGDARAAKSYLRPLLAHLEAHGLGSVSEVFDGDAPFRPAGTVAQAWSVAAVLRSLQQIAAHGSGANPRHDDKASVSE